MSAATQTALTSERKMINSALAGDQQAFTDLYNLHSVKTFNSLRQMTHNKEDAEDLLSRTFAKAFLNLSCFKCDSRFSTWLWRIAFNEFLMYYRSRGFRGRSIVAESLDEIEDGNISIKEKIGAWDLNQRAVELEYLVPFLKKHLPLGFARALILHDLYDLEHWEIAKMLKTTIGCSKSQLSRARIRARKTMRELNYL